MTETKPQDTTAKNATKTATPAANKPADKPASAAATSKGPTAPAKKEAAKIVPLVVKNATAPAQPAATTATKTAAATATKAAPANPATVAAKPAAAAAKVVAPVVPAKKAEPVIAKPAAATMPVVAPVVVPKVEEKKAEPTPAAVTPPAPVVTPPKVEEKPKEVEKPKEEEPEYNPNDESPYAVYKELQTVSQLTPEMAMREQVITWTQAFKKFDTGGRGRMSIHDLQRLMQSLGFSVDQEQAEEMVNLADVDNTGTVELNEFLKLMVGQLRDKHTKHEFARKFQIYDKNNDGYIKESEIRKVSENLGIKLYGDQIDVLIKQADKNKDGKISYNEYVKLMVNHKGTNTYWKNQDEMLASLSNLWLVTDDIGQSVKAGNWEKLQKDYSWDKV